ncbi:hypothetical protein [Cupriavidus oxalaticus]|jgi:hypothetical protein|nr:hypothetical protein [Cupriavidus oxalaticus]WQD85712.1 hypothetical protein U0036_29280 [Cupriavidus oxalaticus]
MAEIRGQDVVQGCGPRCLFAVAEYRTPLSRRKTHNVDWCIQFS